MATTTSTDEYHESTDGHQLISSQIPSSIALRSFLQSISSKANESSGVPPDTFLTVAFKDENVRFECSEPIENCPINLTCKGYLVRTAFSLKLEFKSVFTVTTNEASGQSILKYLRASNRTAVIQTTDTDETFLLTADSACVGSVQRLAAGDAHFLSLMFKLKKVELEPEQSVQDAVEVEGHEINEFAAGHSVDAESCKKEPCFWDANALEAWRMRDSAGFRSGFLR